METVPRKVVLAVAMILVVLAGLGLYQGLRRSSLGDTETGEGGLPTLAAPGAAGAKTASALTDPSAQALNEAQVREIARQEARAAMGQTRTTAAPSADDDEPAAKPAASAPASPAPPRPPVGQPALQTPAGPTAAQPSDAGSAPLF